MNEEPPKCILGCCNVRSWTISVSIMNIVMLTISLILDIGWITQSLDLALFSIITHIFLLYLNIKLRNGVIKNDIAPIRHWLWVYLVLFILSIFTIIVGIVMISFGDFQKTKYEKLHENLPLIIIFCIISEGIMVLCYYPVYQFYIFEKARLQQTERLPGYQAI